MSQKPAKKRGKRVPVSPRLRFEVFKRDNFRCVYCGAASPGVLLHADHVNPVADGGETVLDNLVTACAACNGGKGSVPLSVPAAAHVRAAALAREKEIAEIDDALNEWLNERRKRLDARAAVLVEEWNKEAFRGEWRMSETSRASMRWFVERLLDEQIREAMFSAIRHVPWPYFDPKWTKTGRKYQTATMELDRRFRYFCGACHNMIRRRQGA